MGQRSGCDFLPVGMLTEVTGAVRDCMNTGRVLDQTLHKIINAQVPGVAGTDVGRCIQVL